MKQEKNPSENKIAPERIKALADLLGTWQKEAEEKKIDKYNYQAQQILEIFDKFKAEETAKSMRVMLPEVMKSTGLDKMFKGLVGR